MNLSKLYRPKVTPYTAKTFAQSLEKCLYSVSVAGGQHDITEIVHGFSWAANYFSECGVLIGDGLYRITLQITKGLDEVTAYREARHCGDAIIADFFRRLKNYRPKILRSSDLIEEEAFAGAHQVVERFYATKAEFANSIAADARQFVERQIRKGNLRRSRSQAE